MIVSQRIERIVTCVLCSAALLIGSACGSDQTSSDEQNDQQQTEVVEPIQPGDYDVPVKPVNLSSQRYIDEMINEEIQRAYAVSGEFIDPGRVVELLREEEQQPVAAAENESPPLQEALRTWRISYDVHEQAKALFRQGSIAEAAALWRGLPTDRRAFTISVEVHCDRSRLQQSWNTLESLEMPIFILPETVEGDTCYRLCAGVFADASSARAQMDQIRVRISTSYPFAFSFSSN